MLFCIPSEQYLEIKVLFKPSHFHYVHFFQFHFRLPKLNYFPRDALCQIFYLAHLLQQWRFMLTSQIYRYIYQQNFNSLRAKYLQLLQHSSDILYIQYFPSTSNL